MLHKWFYVFINAFMMKLGYKYWLDKAYECFRMGVQGGYVCADIATGYFTLPPENLFNCSR